MAKVLPELDERLRDFVESQSMFFVGSAPLSGDGHVNVSPKGLDTFRVLDANRVAYLDLTGSGNETAAHLGENGRITIMFCAFKGPPLILRLFGHGRAVLPETAEWAELIPSFDEIQGARQIILVDIHRVQTSCGWGVPRMRSSGNRDQMLHWAASKGKDGLAEYRREKNTASIDGIPVAVAG